MGLSPAKDMQTPSPPLLSFDSVFMDDVECAEYNEKRTKFLFQFLFFELSWKIHWKLEWRGHKNDHNAKNKNRKNLKFDFSFDLADSASFM